MSPKPAYVAVLAVLLGATLATGTVSAHHAFSAEFDGAKPFSVTGTVTKIDRGMEIGDESPDVQVLPCLVARERARAPDADAAAGKAQHEVDVAGGERVLQRRVHVVTRTGRRIRSWFETPARAARPRTTPARALRRPDGP